MNILVAYATNSSGTLVVSVIVANALKNAGHTVSHKDIRTVKPDELAGYDVVVFGSPSWDYDSPEGHLEGQPHEFFRTFIKEAAEVRVPDKKFAIFGLGDTAYINFTGAVDHLESFVKKMGGKLVTTSLRIDGFYFSQSENEAKAAAWTDELAKALSSDTTPAQTELQNG
jgi:flavodoxin I